MHLGVRAMSGKGSLDLLAIRKVPFNEMRARINSGPMAFTQIIENGNFMPLIQQKLRANAPDIARAAHDKNFHWRGKSSAVSGKSKANRPASAAHRAGCSSPICNLKMKGVAKSFSRHDCASS